MTINEKFLKFIEENQLININDKILVGFSGGKDSVFLAYLLIKNNFKFALAHLNHNLRGPESILDMDFCIDFAKKNDLQIFTRSINIKEIAKKKGISIEEAGRIERYNFFHEIANDYNFTKIATAHHLDDQVETFFINFFRKKSIFSLKGIHLKNDKLVRPILCFKREEIEKFIKENNLNHIDDSSNFDTKFLRNRIRYKLIPFLKKEFEVDLFSIIDFYKSKISEIEEVLNFIINQIFHEAVKRNKIGFCLKLENLNQFWNFKILRFEIYKNILIDLNVNFSENLLNEIDKIILSKETTKKLYIHKLKIFKEYREILFTTQDLKKEKSELIIPKPGEYIFGNGKIIIEKVDVKDINFSNKKNEEYVDYDKVNFPLKVRFFKNGDRFIPLGMNKSVKLKDFFINQKIPFRIRRDLFIFEDNTGEIINVNNLRISEKVKIDKNSKKALKFKILLN